MMLSKDGKLLFVANGDSDSISVIDTDREAVVETISLLRPGYRFKGANPNSLALSPDQRHLFVTLGSENAVAMVDLVARWVVGRPGLPQYVFHVQNKRKPFRFQATMVSGFTIIRADFQSHHTRRSQT